MKSKDELLPAELGDSELRFKLTSNISLCRLQLLNAKKEKKSNYNLKKLNRNMWKTDNYQPTLQSSRFWPLKNLSQLWQAAGFKSTARKITISW